MRLRTAFSISAALIVLVNSPSYGWNKSGHMISASLAYRELKANQPDKLAALVKILKQHPHFATYWLPVLNEIDDLKRDEALFMLAARWPDDMRDPPMKYTYHRRIWHFADHKLKFAGAPDDVKDGELFVSKQPGDITEGFDHLLTALPHNIEVLRGNAEGSKRAIALCWVLHLTGDLHQPLHVSTRFSDLFPDGDKGGNSTWVCIPPSTTALNYHSFWDDLVLRGPRHDALFDHNGDPADAEELADAVVDASRQAAKLFARDDLGRDRFQQLAKSELADWAGEGIAIGRSVCYLNGDLSGGADRHDPFSMPHGFSKHAKTIAEQQIAVAGHRLADLLD